MWRDFKPDTLKSACHYAMAHKRSRTPVRSDSNANAVDVDQAYTDKLMSWSALDFDRENKNSDHCIAQGLTKPKKAKALTILISVGMLMGWSAHYQFLIKK